MMVRTVVIPRDPSIAPYPRELADLGDFQGAVGGLLEPLSIERLALTIWTNEAARREQSGFNSRATALYWYYWSGGLPVRFILGDVVLAGAADELLTPDVPPFVDHVLTEPHHFRLQFSRDDHDEWRDTYACFDNIFEAATWCMMLAHRMRGTSGFRIDTDSLPSDTCGHHLANEEQSW